MIEAKWALWQSVALALCLTSPGSAQQEPEVVSRLPIPTVVSEVRCAGQGDEIYAVWKDARAGRFDDRLFFNRSLDGGRSWLPNDVEAGTRPSGISRTIESLVVSGSHLAMIVRDARNGESSYYCSTSSDRGTTWATSDVLIARAGTAVPRGALVAAGRLHFAWSRINSNFYVQSPDFGSTWTTPITIGGTTDGVTLSDWAASEDALVAVWAVTNTGRRGLWSSRSTDWGLTWSPRVRVDDPPADARVYDPRGAKLAIQGNSVHVAWHDNRPSLEGRRVRVNSSLDGGLTWAATSTLLDADPAGTPLFAEEVEIAATPNRVHVAWMRTRSSFGEVGYRSSADSGATWSPQPTNAGTYSSSFLNELSLVAHADHAVLAWLVDGRAQFQRTPDGGTTWPATPMSCSPEQPRITSLLLVEAGANSSVLFTREPALFASELCEFQLYGSQSYGYANPGSGGIAPTCTVESRPFVGEGLDVQLGAALGRTLFVLGGSTTGPADVAVGPLRLLLDEPEILAIGTTDGGFWQPGRGTARLTLPVPNLPELRGTRILLQSFFLDLGAHGWISHTAGREVWLF